jgi:hypothetical protein
MKPLSQKEQHKISISKRTTKNFYLKKTTQNFYLKKNNTKFLSQTEQQYKVCLSKGTRLQRNVLSIETMRNLYLKRISKERSVS